MTELTNIGKKKTIYNREPDRSLSKIGKNSVSLKFNGNGLVPPPKKKKKKKNKTKTKQKTKKNTQKKTKTDGL